MRHTFLGIVGVMVLVGATSRVRGNPPPIAAIEREYAGLDNVLLISPGIVNGSAPENDEGFASLVRLGIKTILSVDGALPDVEAAQDRGMRYVHLPVGYDGISREQGLRILRAVRDLQRPIYVHCHHGKHRSAAVAAFVLVGLGFATPRQATEMMKQAGTSPQYAGLYEAVATAKRVSDVTLDRVAGTFPSRTQPNAIVELMIAMDECVGYLEDCQEADWKSPRNSPDLDPLREADVLASMLGRIDLVWSSKTTLGADDKASFLRLAEGNVTDATVLQKMLSEMTSRENRNGALASLRAGCKSCHETFRDSSK